MIHSSVMGKKGKLGLTITTPTNQAEMITTEVSEQLIQIFWKCKWPMIYIPWFHDDVIKWNHFRVPGLFQGNPLVSGEFPSQMPVTRGFDIFFDLCLNKRFSKQLRRRWFETPLRPLWRHCKLKTSDLLKLTHGKHITHKIFIKVKWKLHDERN